MALLLAALCILKLQKSKFGVFHIMIIYISLMVVDTLIPCILWSVNGYPAGPSWRSPLTEEDLVHGLMYYLLFYFILFVVLISAIKKASFSWEVSVVNNDRARKMLSILLMATAFMFVLSWYIEVLSYGGYADWLVKKFTLRFKGAASGSKSFVDLFLAFIPWRAMFNALVFLAFLFRYKYNRSFLFGIFFPAVAVIFALSTSYRGSILTLLIGLIFVEFVRIKIHKFYNFKSQFGRGKETIHKVKYYVFGFGFVMAFLVYGSVRDSYAAEKLGYVVNSESTVYRVLSQGSGISGVASIVKEYGGNVDYLKGKTYIDMLLLPVPRIIYPSKPAWYGIDDITRGMGWPKSTQSAVTMPGEAFANFGWFGLLMAPVLGVLFAFFINVVNKRGAVGLILYPSVGFSLIFVSNWMSFTGVMNLFFTTLFIVLTLKAAFVRFRL